MLNVILLKNAMLKAILLRIAELNAILMSVSMLNISFLIKCSYNILPILRLGGKRLKVHLHWRRGVVENAGDSKACLGSLGSMTIMINQLSVSVTGGSVGPRFVSQLLFSEKL
jgi:hypothetical protein